jgi:hypothetical protein
MRSLQKPTDLNKKESLIAYREDGKVNYKPWN